MALLEDVACVAGRLGLDLYIDGIAAGNRRHVFQHEAQVIDTSTVGIVAQLDLGPLGIPNV